MTRTVGKLDMRSKWAIAVTCAVAMGLVPQFVRGSHAGKLQGPPETVADPAKILVDRLDLERYKATIKGLTQFGDRKQGTDRNRQAIDWIEAQLKNYGCANIERLKYNYQPPSPDLRNTMANTAGGPGTPTPPNATSVGGGHPRRPARSHRCEQRSERATRPETARTQFPTANGGTPGRNLLHEGWQRAPRCDVPPRRPL